MAYAAASHASPPRQLDSDISPYFALASLLGEALPRLPIYARGRRWAFGMPQRDAGFCRAPSRAMAYQTTTRILPVLRACMEGTLRWPSLLSFLILPRDGLLAFCDAHRRGGGRWMRGSSPANSKIIDDICAGGYFLLLWLERKRTLKAMPRVRLSFSPSARPATFYFHFSPTASARIWRQYGSTHAF